MIRVSKIGAGSSCCIYVFNLSCAGVGDMASWAVDFANNDDGNAPIFNFIPCQSAGDGDQTGYVPFQIDGHPGYSDVDETTDGYAYFAGTLTGGGDERIDWAETAYLEILDLAGGFSHLSVSAVPYDSSTQTVGDVDNPLTADLTGYVNCAAAILGCTMNIFGGGNYRDPTGFFTTPNRVWLFFVPGDAPAPGCSTEPGGGGDLTFAITDGSITSAVISSGTTKLPDPDGACASGGCFTDVEGCSPDIGEGDVASTFDITGPITMTPDPTTVGWFYVSADALGLWDVGAGQALNGICTLQITTNLGPATCIVAHSNEF
jgi:hypothetical protein